MEVEHLKHMGQRLLSAVGVGGGSGGSGGERETAAARVALQDLQAAVSVCCNLYSNQPALATDQDIRVTNLCNQWSQVLSHGIKVPVSTYQPLQNIITAGLNFAFNLNLLDAALWNYTKLHLTKHEEERFDLLKEVRTPKGYFRAFIRSALNEKSFERYLQSWIGHLLITEFYEDWALIRDPECSKTLPIIASDLSSIFFALSIDKIELNDAQSFNQSMIEPVVPSSEPIVKTTVNKKATRKIISFDSDDSKQEKDSANKIVNNLDGIGAPHHKIELSNVDLDSISRLSHSPREEPTSKSKINFDSDSHHGSDVSSIIGEEKKLSESDVEDLEDNLNCLEIKFFNSESFDTDQTGVLSAENEQNAYLKLKISQMETEFKEKTDYMENVIHELTIENNKLKEQLRNYVSAVQKLDRDDIENEEVKLYEAKLVQVAQMHAELMEFNAVLQQKLQCQFEPYSLHYPLPTVIGMSDSSVNIWIPSVYLLSKESKSFHIYQVFLKVGPDEWNVYRRYSEFRKLYSDLKNTHPDISLFKFPPKKALGKKETWLVEQRRGQLQGWLRHIIHSLPQLRQSTTKKDFTSFLPFFLNTGNYENSGALQPVLTL